MDMLHRESVRWFREARFGMFVHWGVYSIRARGEWAMHLDKLTVGEYEKYSRLFNPIKFNAREWITLLKSAGLRYLTFTSKHHDGFCMFDSKLTEYKVTNTPFGRDVVKELAEACRKEGIKLFLYYSPLDWHHPDYYPRGWTGQFSGRPEGGDWTKYFDYYINQVRELCSNYGEIGGIWFDGCWDKERTDIKKTAEIWKFEELYEMIHELQPTALIGNNHHLEPFPGEDFQIFEQDLPGENTAGFNVTKPLKGIPLEACRTMNNSWGYNAEDNKYLSTQQLIGYLQKAIELDTNLLLNVGPKFDGTIPEEQIERLYGIGEWIRRPVVKM